MDAKALARRAGRIARRVAAGLLAVPLLYVVLAIILGLVPANPGWREADRGVVIFVNSNAVHTGIAMPLANGIMDWRPYVPREHPRDQRWGNYILVGYGHRDFYLNTPSWAELSLGTAVNAGLGLGSTLIHVDHMQDPQEGEGQVRLVLSEEEYRRLVDFIRPRFRLDGEGRTIPVPDRGYGPNDMFYEADGGYSAYFTCNEWTGRALRVAGVRMGWWTPTEQGVMWRLQ